MPFALTINPLPQDNLPRLPIQLDEDAYLDEEGFADEYLDEELDGILPPGDQPELAPPSPLPEANLLVHAGAHRVTRGALSLLDVPPATDTFQPVPHDRLIDEIEQSLAFRHISIVRDDYALSPDGMKLFALLEVSSEADGVRFAIGLRNANDKSMRLAMVAGYRVFVCDNMALSGEFKPLLAKHTRGFDLIEAISLGVDRIQRGFEPLRQAIDFKRTHRLIPTEAQALIYRAFMVQRLPMKLMKAVHREFFVEPSYEEFEPQTLWALENAFTTSFKLLLPLRQYEATAKLGKFLQGYMNSQN